MCDGHTHTKRDAITKMLKIQAYHLLYFKVKLLTQF